MNDNRRNPVVLVWLCLALLTLVGCNMAGNQAGNNSSGNGTSSSAMPVGLYMGTGSFTGISQWNDQSFATSPYMLGFVTSTGSYMLLSYSTGSPNFISQIDIGTGTASDGNFTSNNDQNYYLFPNFAEDAPVLGNIQGSSLSATYVLNQSINGSISYTGTTDVLSFPLGIVGQSTQPASLSAIAGTYSGAFYSTWDTCSGDCVISATSTITITPAGALSGTVTCPFEAAQTDDSPRRADATSPDCTVSGTVTARSDIDAYDVSVSFANGTQYFFAPGSTNQWVGVTATGMGYYDSANQKFMFGAVTAGNVPFAFSN